MTTEIDWEDAFANGDYIENAADFPPMWSEQAAQFRTSVRGRLDLPYGDAPREKLDLFLPDKTPKGLIVFVHGGYWQAFDKSSWSHLARGPIEHGWAVAMPSYTLAPEAKIPEITAQIGRAIALVANEVEGPIRLTGHSAGGHLVSRMGCDDTPLSATVTKRIDKIVSISGVHDLRPLLRHSMNEKLGLTEETAHAESPSVRVPYKGFDFSAWVGACERPEFLRQSALITESWSRVGVPARLVADSGKHHFDVIDGLADADLPLCLSLTS